MLLLPLLLLFGVTASIQRDFTDDEKPYYDEFVFSARDPGLPCKVVDNTTLECSQRELPLIPQIPEGTYYLIELTSNNISVVLNNSFITHPELGAIYLGNNFIKTIDILAFRGMFNLSSLFFYNNLLDFIPPKAFEDLIVLQVLDLRSNLFYRTPQDALSKLPALRALRFTLHGNQQFTLENVTALNMEDLRLTGYHGQVLHLTNESFANTPNVNNLWLYCDADAEFNAYKPLTKLKILFMSCSKLDQLHSVTANVHNLTLLWENACNDTPLTVANSISLKPLHKFQTLQMLSLHQEISSIENNAFSWAFTLTKLDLAENNIEDILPGAFNNLTNLQILNLNKNKLVALPSHALQVFGISASLTMLDLSDNFIGLQPIPSNYTYPFGMSKNLQTIFLDSNKISANFFETQCIIHNRLYLHLTKNPVGLSNFKTVFERIPNMFFLQVENNYDVNIPPAGVSSATLQMLSISSNNIQVFPFGPIDFTSLIKQFPSVHSFEISLDESRYCQFLTIRGNLESSTSITSFTLNSACFTSEHFKSVFTGSFFKLIRLVLMQNLLTYIPSDIFSSAPNIEYLDLSGNIISVIDSATMAPLEKLEELYLAQNKLSEMDFLKPVIKTLHVFDLGQNSITKIPHGIFTNASILHNFNLAGNPFACTCTSGVTYFKSWFYSNTMTYVYIIMDDFNYLCDTPAKLKGVVITQVHLFCPSWLLTILTPSLVAFVILASTFLFAIKYRWRIRYKLFQILHQRRYQEYVDDEWEHEDQPCRRRRHFDAYVAYHEDDKDWVLDEMIKNMENEYVDKHGETHRVEQPHGEKIVLHIPERDLQAGQPKVRAVTNAIQNSTKTVLVLSRSFMQSEWCYFQMQIAFERLFSEGRDVIVLVLLEEIPYCNMLRELRKMLRRKSYLKWPENANGHKLFWAQLREKIRKPVRVDRRYEI